jgi:hypothetical protein
MFTERSDSDTGYEALRTAILQYPKNCSTRPAA